ncbi:MAG: rhodanese-related sulfurtransferase [Alphaproteobacteria bacterium]|nr:rhodanese-related sulfurtransferase [Alphaproteobacteria bacterium]
MMTSPFKVVAFYQFAHFPDFVAKQPILLNLFHARHIKGTVLLAAEGINGTIAGPAAAIDGIIAEITAITGLSDLEPKYATAQDMPFRRTKVRLKKEIVTIGPVAADPLSKVGQYVEPEDWNALISDPDVILIDTRNSYEYGVGSFKNALDPQTESFGEFPSYIREKLKAKPDAKIAMFCTGGIRCEKASSFMLHEGFEKVYHLKGGILKYLERIPPEKSLWEGSCFVFDERVAVGHGLVQSEYSICHGCMNPVSPMDRRSPKYEEGVCCPGCADKLTDAQKASNRERQRQINLAKARGEKHLGPHPAEMEHHT